MLDLCREKPTFHSARLIQHSAFPRPLPAISRVSYDCPHMGIDKIGILTDEVSDSFDEALDWCRENGLAHVEARVIDGVNAANLTDDAAHDVRRRVEARGLYISAIASPLFKCALDPRRAVASGDRFGQKEEDVEAHFAKLDRVIAIAKELNAPRIRIFSFWREQEPGRYHDDV